MRQIELAIHGGRHVSSRNEIPACSRWLFEDQLLENYPYDEQFDNSRIVDGVRMFPPVAEHDWRKAHDRTLVCSCGAWQ